MSIFHNRKIIWIRRIDGLLILLFIVEKKKFFGKGITLIMVVAILIKGIDYLYFICDLNLWWLSFLEFWWASKWIRTNINISRTFRFYNSFGIFSLCVFFCELVIDVMRSSFPSYIFKGLYTWHWFLSEKGQNELNFYLISVRVYYISSSFLFSFAKF